MSISPARRDNARPIRRGVTLVETLVAGTILSSVATILSVWTVSTMRSCALAETLGRSHAAILTLHDTLSQDVQHAAQIVERVELDGETVRTAVRGDGLVLRLPAVDANGSRIAEVFDFVVWEARPVPGGRALVRRVAVTRDRDGRPLTVPVGSARRPDVRVMVRDLPTPAAPLFTLDRPVVEVSREVAVDVAPGGRAGSRYTARVRLRNAR